MPALRAEFAGDVLGAALRTCPGGRFRFLAAALRTEFTLDSPGSAVGAVPALLGLRLFAAALGTELALDVLCPALRAVPAGLCHGIAYGLAHLLGGIHDGIQGILGHTYHAAHGSQGHAQARNISQTADSTAVSGDAVLHGL